MKKVITLLLIFAMCISFCACNANSREEKQYKNIAGTYKSLSLHMNNTYHLNENTTFEKEPDTKGTYKVKPDGGFTLTDASGLSGETFIKEGDYYYGTKLLNYFEKDTEYGLGITFDEDGHSNQSFSANYETLDESESLVKQLWLVLKEDGTYLLRDRKIYLTKARIFDETTYNGMYKLEDNILWLNYENKNYPMLLIDGKLYFDIIEKVE